MITVVVQVLCTLKDVLRSFNPHTAHNCVMPSLCTSSLIHPDNPPASSSNPCRIPYRDKNNPFCSSWTPRGCSISTSKISKNCFCAVESMFSIDHNCSPFTSLSSVTIPSSSQALVISVHSSLLHPFLFSQPEALPPPQAISPHLCPPFSHQYSSSSSSSLK